MADTMSDVHDALESLGCAIDGARDQLLRDSTELRRTQERALQPIREWVYEVDRWLQDHLSSSTCRRFHERIEEIEGAWLDEDEDAIVLEYSIEGAMDDYTGRALDEIRSAFDSLQNLVNDEPVMGDDDAAVAIREIAEVICE